MFIEWDRIFSFWQLQFSFLLGAGRVRKKRVGGDELEMLLLILFCKLLILDLPRIVKIYFLLF